LHKDESQLAERDAQASLQQKGVASSFLRSNILQLVSRAKQAALLGARRAGCEPGDKPCPMTPDQIVSAMREDLEGLSDSTQSLLYFMVPVDRKDYWQMIRSAGPLVPDSFFEKLMESVDDYDLGVDLSHTLLRKAIEEYAQDKKQFSNAPLPPGRLEFHYLQIERLQLEEARIAHTFAYYLADRVNELAGKPFESREFGTLDHLPTCLPYSETFTIAEKILKLPEKSRLPADYLQNSGKPQQNAQ